MYQQERLKKITNILNDNKYVTVKYLEQRLHYSSATINRDLNLLKQKNLVKRSYGGVELITGVNVPLTFRYKKMKMTKNAIAKVAANYIEDNDTIFIDGSTTAQYMGKYLTNKKNITVITNNIALISYLSQFDICTVCLGGSISEPPSMLCSSVTIENAKIYRADKMFFSTGSLTSEGEILTSDLYYLLHKTMYNNSKKSYFLADHDKIGKSYNKLLFTFDEITCVISDYNFDKRIIEKFKNTDFVYVNY